MSDKELGPRLPPPAFPPGQRRYVRRSTTSGEGSVPAVRRSDSEEPIEPLYDPIELAFISPDEPLPERKLTLAPEFERKRTLRVEAGVDEPIPPLGPGRAVIEEGPETLDEAGAEEEALEAAALDVSDIGAPEVSERWIGPAVVVDGDFDMEIDEEGLPVEAAIHAAAIEDVEIGEDEEGEATGMDLDAHLGYRGGAAGVRSWYDPHVVDLTDAVQRLGEALSSHGEVALHTGPSMSALDQTLRVFCQGYLAGRRAERKPLAVKLSDDY